MSVVLAAHGIVARPPTQDDIVPLLDAVRATMHDLSQWMPWAHPGYALADAQTWYDRGLEHWRIGSDREFCIVDAATGTIIGGVGINQVNRANGFANLGYWVRAGHTGRGVATAAARLVARFGFHECALARLEIVTLVDHAASRRVAAKVGARLEGIARNRLLWRDGPRDAAVHGLVASDLDG